MLSTTMSYGDLARGLHPLIDLSSLNLTHDNYLFDSDYFSYLVDSPEHIPSPEMHDMDYFPHRVFVIGGNCTGCLLSATDHRSCSSCGTGSDTCCTRRSTVSVRRHNTHPRSKHPYTRRHPNPTLQRTRSLTDIHAPSPLRQSAVLGNASAGQQLCESFEAAHLPGTYPIHTPSTIKPHVLRSIMTTPTSGNSTPASVTPTFYPSRVLAPASAISPISPVRERGFFGRPMTHGQSALGEATSGARSHEGEDDDARTEIGSPEEDMDHGGPGAGGGPNIRLPPIHTLPPMAPIYTGPTTISQDVLLYGPAGVTPAPAELLRNNVHDKLPPVPAFAPPRQATFFGIQNIPVADGSTRFATMCAPGARPTSSRPAYPPAGLAPLVAGHQALAHGGLTAPIERGDTVSEWKERQRAKERADIVVKDGELGPEERAEMEKRISMSVKVINHIYYGTDDVPKTRTPTTATRRLSEDEDSMPVPSVSTRAGSSRDTAYWPPTPASMPSSPESPRTRRGRQRASMRKEVLGETIEREQEDTSRDQPTRTLIWFVTEVLRRSRTSINVLQVALAYLAGAKPEIHKELRAAADCQAELAMKIAGLPAHIREALPGMDWMGGDFTPSPLIDPRRTFLASLVLASKFLLDKAFSNKAWAKLSGLEALEVGKCERALGSALNWRLWVGREVSREFGASTSEQPPTQPQQVFSPAYTSDSLSVISSPPGSQGSSMTGSSTPNLYPDSEPDVLQGYDEVNQWTQTPEYFDSNEPVVVIKDEELQRERSRAAMSAPSEALASRPVLPSIRSFDRPPLRHVASDMVTPQTDSNMGCAHAAPIYVEVGLESPLAYAAIDEPWHAITASHWDFGTDGVVGA
ncbi:unnamed protein product [Rhizoctonia solani]|uniref:Uncharacterized protein n=2 Tax=Rhizoctonia solani TaxID=456999 RepID=A0A8H3GS99_9AGAM|nr:unnamed protein product [Rhizoctonia solani]